MSFRNGAAGCDRRYVALVALVRVVRYVFAGGAVSEANEGRRGNEDWRQGGRGGGELGWFYGRATRSRVVEWRFLLRTSGGPGPEPSSISPPRTAHSIISVMMSARAGGPRNTHQQKDYPSSYHHLPPSLLSIFSFYSSLSLYLTYTHIHTYTFSLSLFISFVRFTPPVSSHRSRPIYRPTRANGQNDLRAKNKLPENPPMTELCILYIVPVQHIGRAPTPFSRFIKRSSAWICFSRASESDTMYQNGQRFRSETAMLL